MVRPFLWLHVGFLSFREIQILFPEEHVLYKSLLLRNLSRSIYLAYSPKMDVERGPRQHSWGCWFWHLLDVFCVYSSV